MNVEIKGICENDSGSERHTYTYSHTERTDVKEKTERFQKFKIHFDFLLKWGKKEWKRKNGTRKKSGADKTAFMALNDKTNKG